MQNSKLNKYRTLSIQKQLLVIVQNKQKYILNNAYLKGFRSIQLSARHKQLAHKIGAGRREEIAQDMNGRAHLSRRKSRYWFRIPDGSISGALRL